MYYSLFNAYEAIRNFLELGGGVLVLIAATLFVMWLLIFERFIYFTFAHGGFVKGVLDQWEAREERKSWNAHQIRDAMVSRVYLRANALLPLIKTLVALCPLLGLLGTVTGMIQVFDVMAVSGTGNARSMAAGVAQATVPTMAGMVAALSGVFASTILTGVAEKSVEKVRESLTFDH
jgi:biopolymer transport protein ExbB